MTDGIDRLKPATESPRHGALLSTILACADPEWFNFMAVASLPAIFNLVCFCFGPASSRQTRFDQISFFAGMAIYAGVLKWIGWNVLTRQLPRETHSFHYTLFPAELFCGLALCCAWFYARNLIGLVWPSTYSLREFSVIPYAMAAVQITALWNRWRTSKRFSALSFLDANAAPLAMYAMFTSCLFLALRDVSCALHVQSTDPLCHGFFALTYLRNGTFNGGFPAVYTTGFGAINAVTVELAPVTIVRAIAFQHVLLTFVAFFCITGTICFALRRHLWALHGLIVPYLLLLPLYNLRPWDHYEGTPRQAGPALAVAFCLLPALYSTAGRTSFYLIQFATVMLEWLCVALNPACAPFVLVLTPVAIAIFCFKARSAKQSVLRAVGVHVGFVILIGAVVIACDPFYRGVVSPGASGRPDVIGQKRTTQPASFSTDESLKWIAAASPATFEISYERVFFEYPRLKWMPAGVAALFFATLLVSFLFTPNSSARSLLAGCAAGIAAWLCMVYFIAAMRGGLVVNGGSWDLVTLLTYLGLLLLRMEIALLFFILTACVALLYDSMDGLSWRLKSTVFGVVAVLAAMFLPLDTMLHFRQSAFTVANLGCNGPVSHDDLKLVEWADRNLAGKPGLLGMGAITFQIGPEKHIYPFGGSQAVLLDASLTNSCFFSCDPVHPQGYDDYIEHVQNNFDAQWCLDNKIQWFYIKDDVLAFSPSLVRAIKMGSLKPLQTYGTSTIYQVLAHP